MKINEKLNWISLCILIFTSLWVTTSGADLRSYVIYFLIFLANGQLRNHFFRGKGLLFSIFLELILVYTVAQIYGGALYLLVYISVFDGLRLLSEEKIFTTIFSVGLLYLLLKDREMEIIILNILLLLTFVMLVMALDKMHKTIEELENNYDKNRKYSYQLEESKVRLEQYNRNIQSLAQMEERNRISHEIHDTIGHRLTAILLQIEAVIRTKNMAEDTKIMMQSIRDNLSESVDILRKTVKKISSHREVTGINSIKKLAMDFEKATAVKVNLEIKGLVRKLLPSIELTVFKNIQEAMTNAVRHGNCTEINILVIYNSNGLEFVIHNNGESCSDVKMGMGLKGMLERTELMGGNLQVGSKGKGFEVKGYIPIGGEVI